jgi:hypothetical protein
LDISTICILATAAAAVAHNFFLLRASFLDSIVGSPTLLCASAHDSFIVQNHLPCCVHLHMTALLYRITYLGPTAMSGKLWACKKSEK